MNEPALPVIERRFTSGAVEIRQSDTDTKKMVRGYAAIFNSRSTNLGGENVEFYESISPCAFDDVMGDDVRALFNHDSNLILARSKGGKGTLRVGTDTRGLWYEFEAPDTQAGRDLMVSLERGDVDQSSFAFQVGKDGQEWQKRMEGEKIIYERTIKRVKRLMDVSPVTYPAYPDATVALRSLAEFQAESPAKQQEQEAQPAPDADSEARSRRITRLSLGLSD
jgi:hypothetical protein